MSAKERNAVFGECYGKGEPRFYRDPELGITLRFFGGAPVVVIYDRRYGGVPSIEVNAICPDGHSPDADLTFKYVDDIIAKLNGE